MIFDGEPKKTTDLRIALLGVVPITKVGLLDDEAADRSFAVGQAMRCGTGAGPEIVDPSCLDHRVENDPADAATGGIVKRR